MNTQSGYVTAVDIYATVRSRVATCSGDEIAGNAVSLPRIKSRSFPTNSEFEAIATWFPKAAYTLADVLPQERE